MFVEAISEKAAVVNWVENFLKNQPVFVKDEKDLPKRKVGLPFTKKDGDIRWNFTKFLVDKSGNVIERYSPTFKPEDMEEDIKNII